MAERIKNVIGHNPKITGNCILGDKKENNNPAVHNNPVVGNKNTDKKVDSSSRDNKNKDKKVDCSSGPSSSLQAESKNVVRGNSWIPGNLIIGDENTKNATFVESNNTVGCHKDNVGCQFNSGKNVIGCGSEISGNVICGDENSWNTPVVRDGI